MNINDALNIANPIQGMADLTGYSANQLNREQFREQMNFSRYQFEKQIEMANSAHQRERKDLEAAGLNPVLTAMGGQGANSAAGVHMPNIPDNTATQKGMLGLLNMVMSIAPQIAGMKNANAALTQARASENLAGAQSAKLFAEAGKIAGEKEINDIIKLMKSYEYKHYPDIIESQISRSPLWMINKVRQMFNYGTNTSAAKNFETLAFKSNNPVMKAIGMSANPGQQLAALLLKILL